MEIAVKEQLIAQTTARYAPNIPAASIHKLALLADQVYFPRNSTILELDEPQEQVYLIQDGLARSSAVDEQGHLIVKNFMLEGDFLIGESLFSATSTESFSAIEDLHCLRFAAAQMKPILMADAALTQLYIAVLEDTLRYKMRREYGFQNLDAAARYQEFRALFGKAEARIPQNQIASYIGITKESLSRIRKNLASR
ncbi:Crp/Fnr family transcriptional regulator [Lacticaseibacillus mingshuiensis]|nr:Crp/Fnr family transcriptional regulator [Lacticaseibacillus mingshuiensis]